MPTTDSNISTVYQQKLIIADLITRLSGNYFAAQIFNSQMALDPRKGMASRFGTSYTFEKEASTTYRKLTKGGTIQYDTNPLITSLTLDVDTFSYIGLKTDEFDYAAYNGVYMATNYLNARARDLAVNLEKDILFNILGNADIPATNSISLAGYTNSKLTRLTINDAVTKLKGHGLTGGGRIFTVLDTTRAGELRADLANFNDAGNAANTQLLNSGIAQRIFGSDVFEILGGGSFDRFPAATTSDGVSGTGDIVGFLISEEAYKITGIQLEQNEPNVTINVVNDPNMPLGLRRVQGYDMDTMTKKDVLGCWWGDLLVRPELVIPITLS
jgi:hypothetical protein